MIVDLNNNALNATYKLMSQTIIPRPIAWVVTENDGIINVAPFSYFIGLSSKPATVLISVGHKSDGTPKDTLNNIRKNQKCTICMVNQEHLEAMHFSSKELDRDVSEADLFKIETQKLCESFPPMIKGAPIAYCCTLNQEINLGGSTIPLILNVEQIYVDDTIISDKERLSIAFNPVARVGKGYALMGEELPTPQMP